MAGAVPVVEGKVTFTRQIEAPALDKAQIYRHLLEWGEKNYATDLKRVAYQDASKGEIAIIGEDYLVFSSTALSLDRTTMKYRVIIECADHACTLSLTGIRYIYNVSYQREPERYAAEEWITDEFALNKSKSKLNRISGKFRKATIDFAEQTFDSAAAALGVSLPSAKQVTGTPAQTEPKQAAEVIPATPLTPAAPMAGFVAFAPDKVPSTILQMLPENALQVATTDGSTSDDKATWKGTGNLFGKSICTISLSQQSPLRSNVGENGIYRLSFSKPESASEPWIIIDCRKQGETSEGDQTLWIGEIINVWIK